MEAEYLKDVLVREMIRLKKAELWEEAKGKLRAIVAVEGSCASFGVAHEENRARWPRAEAAIETFIETFEGEGLNE